MTMRWLFYTMIEGKCDYEASVMVVVMIFFYIFEITNPN